MAKTELSLETLQRAHEMTKKVARYIRRCNMRLVINGDLYQVVRDLSQKSIQKGRKTIIVSTNDPYKLMESYYFEWWAGMSWQPNYDEFWDTTFDEFIALVVATKSQACRT